MGEDDRLGDGVRVDGGLALLRDNDDRTQICLAF
jgi:hypothetical protein